MEGESLICRHSIPHLQSHKLVNTYSSKLYAKMKGERILCEYSILDLQSSKLFNTFSSKLYAKMLA